MPQGKRPAYDEAHSHKMSAPYSNNCVGGRIPILGHQDPVGYPQGSRKGLCISSLSPPGRNNSGYSRFDRDWIGYHSWRYMFWCYCYGLYSLPSSFLALDTWMPVGSLIILAMFSCFLLLLRVSYLGRRANLNLGQIYRRLLDVFG